MIHSFDTFEGFSKPDSEFDKSNTKIENQEGDRRFVDPSQVYNVDIQNDKETTDALKNIGNGNQEQILLGLNTTVSLKAFINQIDTYLLTSVDLRKATSGGLFPIYSESNKFIFRHVVYT